jgi:hypothetical protein
MQRRVGPLLDQVIRNSSQVREVAMKSSLWSRGAAAVAAGGVLAAIMATTPAFGNNSPAATTPKILVAGHPGTIKLKNANIVIVSLKVPAGKWLLSAKLWADSQSAKPTSNIVVGCSMFTGGKFLDNSAFNTPKVGGAGGTAAGVEDLTAVINIHSKATITLRCDDFGSMAQSHSAVLTAIGT